MINNKESIGVPMNQVEHDLNHLKKRLLKGFMISFLALSLILSVFINQDAKSQLSLISMTVLLSLNSYALIIGWFHIFLATASSQAYRPKAFLIILKYAILLFSLWIMQKLGLFDLKVILLSTAAWSIGLLSTAFLNKTALS
jgi:hypothetical protein